MRAAIIAIGDELTLGESLDTNSAWLAARLRERSVDVREHRTVGDVAQQIGFTIAELAQSCDVIILTGGLGPTADDLTRTGLGHAVTPGQALVQDADALRHLEALYRTRHKTMATTNLVQTYRPETTTMIANPNGTAMGLADSLGGCRVFALPGPPREMQPMFDLAVVPHLPAANDDNAAMTRFVHAYGLAESEASQKLGDLLARNRSPQLGITVSRTILTVRIRAQGSRETISTQIEDDTDSVQRALWPYVFGGGDDTLASTVGDLLGQRGATVATAESCTGGMLGAMLVDVAGSSNYYAGGWVTYSDAMKSRCLGVSEKLLAEHGAVSKQVASAMAVGAVQQSGAAYGISITGIAGPGGGSDAKPVGLVYIGLAETSPGSMPIVEVRRFQFVGDRLMIRQRSAFAALQMARFRLLDVDPNVQLLWQVAEPGSDNAQQSIRPTTTQTSDGI